MNLLRRVNTLLTRLETVLLVALLATMVLLSFLQVLLRNLFGTGLLWADPLVRYLVLWVGFLGAALATSSDRHISIDALTRFFPPRAKCAVKSITTLFAGVTCGFLFNSSITFLSGEKASGSVAFLSIPSWIALSIIPAGYVLLTAHFLLVAAENALATVKKTVPREGNV
jgi:TRAP-type C4-dicarboxylate transport system permease small subunit